MITRVDSCSNPAYMGTEQVREVDHAGGLKVLRPPVRAYTGRRREQRVLYWERISDVGDRRTPRAEVSDFFRT